LLTQVFRKVFKLVQFITTEYVLGGDVVKAEVKEPLYVVGVLEKVAKVGACGHYNEDAGTFLQLPQVHVEES